MVEPIVELDLEAVLQELGHSVSRLLSQVAFQEGFLVVFQKGFQEAVVWLLSSCARHTLLRTQPLQERLS